MSQPPTEAAEARGPQTRWWQALLLITAAVVVCGLVVELAARAVSFSMGKGFWSRPHSFESAFFVTYDWPPPLIEGERGTFRDGQTLAMRKAPGELRVICLGGSTTVNARNAEGLTYSGVLQETLAPRFEDHSLQILNAGGDAFASAHSLANLSLRLVHFEPDVVTVLHNINDLTATYYGTHLLPDYSNKYLDDTFLAYEHRGGFGGSLFRVSRGLQMLKWRWTFLRTTLEPSSRGPGVANPDLGLKVFKSNLTSIVAVSRAHGARPILLTQAHRDGEESAEGGRFRLYNAAVRRVAEEQGAAWVDLSQSLSGHEPYFLDAVHFTSPGVRAVAREIEPVLEQEIRGSLRGAEPP
ncbi:MAG: GDSL-type esterase/lipase family protein [Acidobacteriota bacterium]